MLRICLCDDNPGALAAMQSVVQDTFAAEQKPCQIRSYETGEHLLWDVQDGDATFDILLLDLEMPSMSGLELSARLEALLPCAVQIFVTDHMRYVLDAFELPAFRYIPKDQLKRRLPRALRDAAGALEHRAQRHYIIHRASTVERLPFEHILFISRGGKNAQFHTKDGISSVRKSLTQVLAELDSEEFVLTDRGCIANLSMITAIRGSEAVLTNGERVPISRNRLSEVRQQFAAYWGRRM